MLSTVGLAITSTLAAVAWFAQIEADNQRIRAEQTGKFLIELLESANPTVARGETPTVRDILDLGARRLEYADINAEIRSDLQLLVGGVYLSLGSFDEAEEFSNESLEFHRNRADLDDAGYADALQQLAVIKRLRGDYPIALELQNEVLELRRSIDDEQMLARSQQQLAEIYIDTGRYDEAEEMLGQAIAIQQRIEPAPLEQLADSHSALATVFQEQRDYPRAVSEFRKALAVAESRGQTVDAQLAYLNNNLALALKYNEEFDEAESHYETSIELRRKLYGDGHPALGLAIHNLGAFRRDRLADDGGIPELDEALGIFREVHGESHPTVAMALYNKGLALNMKHRYAEAVPVFEASLAQRREFFGEEHNRTGQAYVGLGIAPLGAGDVEGARWNMLAAIRINEAVYGETSLAAAGMRLWLGDVHFEAGEFDELKSLYADSLAVIERERGAASRLYVSVAILLAEVEYITGNSSAAREWLDRVEPDLTDTNWRRMIAVNLRAALLADAGNDIEARALFEESLAAADAKQDMDPKVNARMRERAADHL